MRISDWSSDVCSSDLISCLVGPNDDVMIPRGSAKTDWEVELGVVIGKTCRYVEQADALDHVAGYVLVNDVSERAFQKELGTPWAKIGRASCRARVCQYV